MRYAARGRASRRRGEIAEEDVQVDVGLGRGLGELLGQRRRDLERVHRVPGARELERVPADTSAHVEDRGPRRGGPSVRARSTRRASARVPKSGGLRSLSHSAYRSATVFCQPVMVYETLILGEGSVDHSTTTHELWDREYAHSIFSSSIARRAPRSLREKGRPRALNVVWSEATK